MQILHSRFEMDLTVMVLVGFIPEPTRKGIFPKWLKLEQKEEHHQLYGKLRNRDVEGQFLYGFLVLKSIKDLFIKLCLHT